MRPQIQSIKKPCPTCSKNSTRGSLGNDSLIGIGREERTDLLLAALMLKPGKLVADLSLSITKPRIHGFSPSNCTK